MQVQQIKCDICNRILKDNEKKNSKVMLGLGGEKPVSTYNISLTYEGINKKGDLCLSCAKQIHDHIENMKIVENK